MAITNTTILNKDFENSPSYCIKRYVSCNNILGFRVTFHCARKREKAKLFTEVYIPKQYYVNYMYVEVLTYLLHKMKKEKSSYHYPTCLLLQEPDGHFYFLCILCACFDYESPSCVDQIRLHPQQHHTIEEYVDYRLQMHIYLPTILFGQDVGTYLSMHNGL